MPPAERALVAVNRRAPDEVCASAQSECARAHTSTVACPHSGGAHCLTFEATTTCLREGISLAIYRFGVTLTPDPIRCLRRLIL